MEKILQVKGTKKQAGVITLIWDKIDFKLKLIRSDEKGHYILIKGTINQKDIIIINTTLQDLKAQINLNTLIEGTLICHYAH